MQRRLAWILFVVAFLARADGLSPSQERVLQGIARDRFTGRWTDLTTNQLLELRTKAEAYDQRIRERHLPGGMVVSLRYASTNAAEPVSYEALEHSASWTGIYLASCAYRWAVMHEARNLGDVRLALDGLTRAAQATGKPGVIPPFAGRAADELYKPVYGRYGGEDPKRPSFGRLAFRGEGNQANLVWLGVPNRQDYSAVNLGLATTWFYIRDAKIRGQVSNLVLQVVRRLEFDGWRIDDGKGHVTFADPLLAAAWLRTAATIQPRDYGEKYERAIADIHKLREHADLQETGFPRYGDQGAAFTRLLNVAALNRNETNQSRRIAFQERISRFWQQSGSSLNPLPAALFLSAFERIPVDSTARAVLQGMLYAYPAPPRWSRAVDLTGEPNLERIEVDGVPMARYAQLLDRRPVAPFQWSEPATRIEGGLDEPVAHPGIDLLFTYWIGRDVAITPAEDSVAPLDLKLRPAPGKGGKTNAPALSRSTNAPPGRTNAGTLRKDSLPRNASPTNAPGRR